VAYIRALAVVSTNNRNTAAGLKCASAATSYGEHLQVK